MRKPKKQPPAISDEALLKMFNDSFENATERPKIVPGKALITALRAVYTAGWEEAQEP